MPKQISRAEFIEAAPAYYALAIAAYFSSRGGTAYQANIESEYTFQEEEDGFEVNRLENSMLFDQGIVWLEARGMIEALPDMFGPTVYRQSDSFVEGWRKAEEDRRTPFYKYGTLANPSQWLLPALKRLNEVCIELQINEEDFTADLDEWTPLPLDREHDPSLQKAIETLDKVILEIRADNGYAANEPEERNFVLESLDSAAKKLKTAQTICVPYLRQYVLQPLAIVLKRFEDAALSVAISAAREAAIEFIKTHAARLLEVVIKHL